MGMVGAPPLLLAAEVNLAPKESADEKKKNEFHVADYTPGRGAGQKFSASWPQTVR